MSEIESIRARPAVRLTPRERQIVQAYSLGATTKEIGEALGIKEGTVKKLTQTARLRNDAHTMGQLVAMALRAGVIAIMLVGLMASAALAESPPAGTTLFSDPPKVVTQIEHAMGHPFRQVAVYMGLGESARFPTGAMRHAMSTGATVYLNLTPFHQVNGRKVSWCYPAIATGGLDSSVAAWANAIKATGYSKFIFTFNHEPEVAGSVHHPVCGPTANTPTWYKRAFIRVHTIFRNHGLMEAFAFVATGGRFQEPGGVAVWMPWGYFSRIGIDARLRADKWVSPTVRIGPFYTWWAAHGRLPMFFGEFGIDSSHSGAASMLTSYVAWINSHFGAKCIGADWDLSAPYDLYTPALRAAFLAAT